MFLVAQSIYGQEKNAIILADSVAAKQESQKNEILVEVIYAHSKSWSGYDKLDNINSYPKILLRYSRVILQLNESRIKGQLGYGYTFWKPEYGHYTDFMFEFELKRVWHAMVLSAGIGGHWFSEMPSSYIKENLSNTASKFRSPEPLYILGMGCNIRPLKRLIIKPSINWRFGRYSFYTHGRDKSVISYNLQIGYVF
jgi:hypothetical protein